MSGVPRIIHTTNLERYFSGLKWDIEPNAMSRPSGNAPMSVTKNSFRVCKKPILSERITIGNCSIISCIRNLLLLVLFWRYSMRAACTPYFSAIASILPSWVLAVKKSFSAAARSEPLRKPTPYSSLLSPTV